MWTHCPFLSYSLIMTIYCKIISNKTCVNLVLSPFGPFFQLFAALQLLCKCLHSQWTAVRHMAARCVGALARLKTLESMSTILETLLPWLGASQDITKRLGAMEALASILCSFWWKYKSGLTPTAVSISVKILPVKSTAIYVVLFSVMLWFDSG